MSSHLLVSSSGQSNIKITPCRHLRPTVTIASSTSGVRELVVPGVIRGIPTLTSGGTVAKTGEHNSSAFSSRPTVNADVLLWSRPAADAKIHTISGLSARSSLFGYTSTGAGVGRGLWKAFVIEVERCVGARPSRAAGTTRRGASVPGRPQGTPLGARQQVAVVEPVVVYRRSTARTRWVKLTLG